MSRLGNSKLPETFWIPLFHPLQSILLSEEFFMPESDQLREGSSVQNSTIFKSKPLVVRSKRDFLCLHLNLDHVSARVCIENISFLFSTFHFKFKFLITRP